MDGLLPLLGLDSFHGSDVLVVAVLVVLEGLLSCDNAVVLALLVKDLPPAMQGKALRYGILGAYAFRVTALFLAVWIMGVWWIKVLGGVYLCWLAVDYFRKQGGNEGAVREVKRVAGLGVFWSTVVWVELTDIVFSVDSITAAVALSRKLWVLIIGGLLGILAMRFAAQGFVRLLQRFPRLEGCAFAAVAVVGCKLLLEFPVDVAGFQRPLPAGTTYGTAHEYMAAVDTHLPAAYAIPHVLAVNLAAPPAPERERFTPAAEAAAMRDAAQVTGEARAAWIRRRGDDQFAEANACWATHHRPFLEIEGWASSLAVLAIFLTGFRRPGRPPAGA